MRSPGRAEVHVAATVRPSFVRAGFRLVDAHPATAFQLLRSVDRHAGNTGGDVQVSRRQNGPGKWGESSPDEAAAISAS